MKNIPTYKDWLEKTAVTGKPRSQALKEIDNAIKNYETWKKSLISGTPAKEAEEKKLVPIKVALRNWQSIKGDWVHSDRNKTHIVAQLDFQLSDIQFGTALATDEEKKAWRYLTQERQKAIVTLFKGKEVTFKLSNLKGDLNALNGRLSAPNPARDALWNENPLYDDKVEWHKNPLYDPLKAKPAAPPAPDRYGRPVPPAKKIQPIGMGMGKDGNFTMKAPSLSGVPRSPEQAKAWAQEKAESIIKQIFNVSTLTMLGSLTNVVLSIVKLALLDIAPLIGHIKDGVGMVNGIVKTAQSFYKAHNICQKQYVIDLGNPERRLPGAQNPPA